LYIGRFSPSPNRLAKSDIPSFTAISSNEIGYFIEQVKFAGLSFGVAQENVEAVASVLTSTLGYRCRPPTNPMADGGDATLQSICTTQECPVDEDGECALYPGSGVSVEPAESIPGCCA
jgi:hypothetical protein